jgi:zinc transporter, ZIP family
MDIVKPTVYINLMIKAINKYLPDSAVELYIIVAISIVGPILGSLIGVMGKPSSLIMHNMLAFSAGIMLSISFLDLIPEAIKLSSIAICSIGVLFGAVVMYIFDKLIPHIHPRLCQQEQGCNIERTAIFLMLGICLHNFPEGMAMAAGAATGSGLAIAIAIAIHDIPEGICTSAPYYFCSKNRMKSFLLSSATAIPVVFGFLTMHFIFNSLAHAWIGLIIASTAGLMIYISADELIPASSCKLNGWSHSTIFSLIAGVIFVILI